MATVRLTIAEAQGELPPICMVCGKKAKDTIRQRMSFKLRGKEAHEMVVNEGAKGALALIFPWYLNAITTKRAILRAPLCARHLGHWIKPILFLLLSLLGLVGLIFGSLQVTNDTLQVLLVVSLVVLLVCWIIMAVRLKKSRIRPEAISDSDIVLVNVSQAFVDAFSQIEKKERHVEPLNRIPLRSRRIRPGIRDERSSSSDEFQE